jgi:multidrug efflux pump subunit AcrA (membrane-fusion protein)
VGPGHFGLKMITVIVIAGVLFLTFATGVHRVKAPTVLEGFVQRAIGAPFSGYLVEAPARPGDVVRQGDMLSS